MRVADRFRLAARATALVAVLNLALLAALATNGQAVVVRHDLHAAHAHTGESRIRNRSGPLGSRSAGDHAGNQHQRGAQNSQVLHGSFSKVKDVLHSSTRGAPITGFQDSSPNSRTVVDAAQHQARKIILVLGELKWLFRGASGEPQKCSLVRLPASNLRCHWHLASA